MTPERVVIVNDRAAAKGGASGLALLSARLLAARGIALTYVTGDEGAAELAGIAGTVALGGAGLVERGAASALTTGLYNPAARRALAGWIAANDTPRTVYHLHGWSKILSPAVLGALAPVAARTVLHAHDYFLACPNGAFMNYRTETPCPLVPMSRACLGTNCDKRSYAQKLWRVARHAVLERTLDPRTAPCDILLIHPGMAQSFMRYGVPAARLVPVRNPVEPLRTEPVDAAANKAAFFIGRLEVEKGIEDFCEAGQQAGVPLEVIGDGPLGPALRARFPAVVFHGWCDRARIGALLGRARVVVMPTRYPEPFGLVAVEALTSGVPVLVSGTALIADDIVPRGMGRAFRAGDPASCAKMLAEMAADDGAIAAMAARARRDGATLANTPATWCDALLSRYGAALERAAAGAVRRAA